MYALRAGCVASEALAEGREFNSSLWERTVEGSSKEIKMTTTPNQERME